MSTRANIVASVKDKLNTLEVRHNLTDTELDKCIDDTLREMKLADVSAIQEMSDTELYFELRTVYYALMRVRNTNLDNFDYKTASDGMEIDKMDISKNITKIMDEIDSRFKSWLNDYLAVNKSTTASTVWNKSRREKTSLGGY